jgi:hypothetical protein
MVVAGLVAVGTLVPVTSAGAADPPPDPLVRIRADRGSLQPVEGEPGVYDLTLRGVDARGACKGDEPRLCTVPGRAARKILDESDDVAPRPALLRIPGAPESKDAAALGLTDPKFDVDQHSLSFRATKLGEGGGGLAPTVPRRFGAATLQVAPNGYAGCNVAIHFRAKGYPGNFTFIQKQDVIGDAWISNIKQGEIFDPVASDGRVEAYYARKFPKDIWCRMGLLWRSQQTGQGFFVWFNNYVFKKSDWGCTPPPGYKCQFSGNESGQPLKLDVTLVPV